MIHTGDMAQLEEVYPILKELPTELLHALEEECTEAAIPANRTLFDKDSPCDTFLMLLSGTVRVIMPTRSGREILLYRLYPGESCILTVSCLLAQSCYPARAVSENDLAAILVPAALFYRLMDGSARFREFVFRFFAQRIPQLIELLEEVAIRKLDQRLAAVLLARGDTVMETHQMLADELGTVREVVSRTLKAFEEKGILRLGRGKIEILNRSHLKNVAHSLSDQSH